MEITYLEHNQIDKKKWDSCIENSYNGIIYAFSWYLDIVSEDWDALVSNDYETVLPLTFKKKYGIEYLTQPIYSQQLGVFSTQKLDKVGVNEFLNAIPSKYKLVDIKLNIFNHSDLSEFKIFSNTNYELDLISPYDNLKKNFSVNTKRNIGKALKAGIEVVESVTANDLIEIFKSEVGNPKNKFGDKEYSILRQLISFAIRHRAGEILGAYTKENTLCAATFFVHSHNKIINLVSASTDEGKANRAMFLIMDSVIRRNAGNNMILDFEGSNIEGIARFFKGFGSTKCEYQTVTRNNLPLLLRLFKK